MSFVIGIILFLLQLAGFALLVYCVMSFVMPQSSAMNKISAYVEPILSPFRVFLVKLFPKLESMAIDFSPLLAWLVIEIIIFVLKLLRNLF